jgi:hypothetical protein
MITKIFLKIVQQCHISRILEMRTYLPREMWMWVRRMRISKGDDTSPVGNDRIFWRRCRGRCGMTFGRFTRVSKFQDMWYYSNRSVFDWSIFFHHLQLSIPINFEEKYPIFRSTIFKFMPVSTTKIVWEWIYWRVLILDINQSFISLQISGDLYRWSSIIMPAWLYNPEENSDYFNSTKTPVWTL